MFVAIPTRLHTHTHTLDMLTGPRWQVNMRTHVHAHTYHTQNMLTGPRWQVNKLP